VNTQPAHRLADQTLRRGNEQRAEYAAQRGTEKQQAKYGLVGGRGPGPQISFNVFGKQQGLERGRNA
jgi:hypothetical protein